MRLRPLLLLLLLAAAPLADAAVDPGARELKAFTDTTAGVLARGNGLILVGTEDPGDNSISPTIPGSDPPPGHDAAVWFLYDDAGELEIDFGSADIAACSDTGNAIGQDDCKSPVEAVATDAFANHFVVAARSDSGLVLRFEADPGATTLVDDIDAAGGTPLLDVAEDGSMVAIAYQATALSWVVDVFPWNTETGAVTLNQWETPYALPGAPDGFDLSEDGDRITVTSGESYIRLWTSDKTAKVDDSFVGTAGGVAVASDLQHTSIMGTSAGRLRFHDDTLGDDDRRLTFKRADSPITTLAVTDDATIVAWGNEAGTFGMGQYAPTENFFQVLGETDVGGEPDHITLNADGTVAVVVVGDTVHAFGRSGLETFPLWNTTLADNLRTASVTADGDTILVPVTGGVQVFDALYGLNVTGDAPTLKPGEAGELTLHLRNDGNRLLETPLVAKTEPGWTLAPREDSIVVAPGETVEVVDDVTPLATQAPGTYDLDFETEKPDGTKVTHAVDVKLETVVDWAIGLRDGAQATLSAEAGAPVTFQLYVQNKGNTLMEAPLRTKVNDAAWTVGFTSGDGKIQAGDTADLDIVVTPPADALELDEATVTVNLEGFGEPLKLRAVVGAVFGMEIKLPPGITVEAGTSKTFNVTVRNVGNTEDSATVRFGDLSSGWTGTFALGAFEAKVKDIDAKGEKTVQATLTVPEDAQLEAPFLVLMSASSFGPSAEDGEDTMLVTVVAPEADEPEEDSPGLPLVGLLVALGVAFVVRRR